VVKEVAQKRTSMIETVVGGIVLAVISALGWIAYTHPRQFPRIAKPLCQGVATLWLFAISTSVIDIATSASQLSGTLADDPNTPIQYVSYPIRNAKQAANRLVWSTIIGAGAAVYLIVLLFLPKILDLENATSQSETPHSDSENWPRGDGST
jgi:uncharacterized membrane protein